MIEPQSLPEPIDNHPDAITPYRRAVTAMAVAPLLVIVAGSALAFFDKALPDYVVAIGSLMGGGLLTLVAKDKS